MESKFDWIEAAPRGKVRYRYKYRKEGTGYHVSSIQYGPEGSGGESKRVSKAFADKNTMMREMEGYVDALHAKVFGRPSADMGERPLRFFADKYFNSLAVISGWDTGKRSTRYQYRTALYNRLIPKLGDKPIGEITLADCERVLDECVGWDAASAGAKDAGKIVYRSWLLNILQTVFRYAKIVGVIPTDPLAGIKLSNMAAPLIRHVTEQRMKPKSIPIDKLREVLEVVEANVETESEFIATGLMAGLGSRDSATAGLRFCDMIRDTVRDIVSARVALQSDADRKLNAGLKTEASYRMIPVLPEIRRIVDKRFAYLKRTYPDKTDEELGLLTIACKGNDPNVPCNLSDIRAAAARVFKAAGIDKNSLMPLSESMKAEGISDSVESPTAYVFRRNFSSLLFDVAGLDDEAAMYLMGHSRLHSSDNRGKNYGGAEQQYALYKKMRRISYLLSGNVEDNEFILYGQTSDAAGADMTEMYLDIVLGKGDSLDLILSGLEPHDDMEISISGMAPMIIKATAFPGKGDYKLHGTNVLGNAAAMALCGRHTPAPAPKAKAAVRSAADVPEDVPGWQIIYIGDEQDADIPGWERHKGTDFDWDALLKDAEAMITDDPGGASQPQENQGANAAQDDRPAAPSEKMPDAQEPPDKPEKKAAETAKSKMLLMLTAEGYLFRIREGLLTGQNRNTKGVRIMNAAALGEPVSMLLIERERRIAAISDAGVRYTLALQDIPCADSFDALRGKEAARFCLNPCPDGRITHIFHLPEAFDSDISLVLATNRGGVLKRHLAGVFGNSTATIRERKVISLRDGETVIGSAWCRDYDSIMLLSSNSHVLACRAGDIPGRRSAAQSIKGISLKGDEGTSCIGIVKGGGVLVTISSDGLGKITESACYHPQDDPSQTYARGGIGKQSNNLNPEQRLAAGMQAHAAGSLYLAASDGRVLMLSAQDIPQSGRIAGGNILMSLWPGARVCCGAWG